MQVMLCQIVTIVRPIAEAEDRRRVRAVVQLARHVLAVHRATAGVNLILFVRCLCETSRQEPERRELRVSVHWHVADPLFQSPLGVQTNERHRVCQSALFPRWILSQRGRKNQPGCRMKHKAHSRHYSPLPPRTKHHVIASLLVGYNSLLQLSFTSISLCTHAPQMFTNLSLKESSSSRKDE